MVDGQIILTDGDRPSPRSEAPSLDLRNPEVRDLSLRALNVLLDRQLYMRMNGLTFDGRRDLYAIFGYDRLITTQQYRDEYARGGIAKRIIEAYPKATWRGGVELYEDEDPKKETDFEKAFKVLEKKFKIWSVFQAADILAGQSTYSVILIGAKGTPLNQELPKGKGKPDNLLFFQPFYGGGGPGDQSRHNSSGPITADTDVTIEEFDVDPQSPRFGEPLTYRMRRTDFSSPLIAVPVHWSRVIHICEGALDNRVYGVPTLQAVWNLLGDLMKITGGGSESFFQRAKHTLNANIGKDATYSKGDLADLKTKFDEYMHNLTTFLPTRDVDVKLIEASVANFANQVDSILTQIAGTTGIPKRILTGSEMGELASTQDAANFDSQVQDRRTGHAGPNIVEKTVDRLIEYGYLPTPEQYEVGWPVKEAMTQPEKATFGVSLANVNHMMGQPVFTVDEIREMTFGMEPLTDEQRQAELDAMPKPVVQAAPGAPPDANQAPEKQPAQLKAAEEQTLRQLEEAIRDGDMTAIGRILQLTPRKYATTQVQIPTGVADKVLALGQSIPDADLNVEAGGRETDVHVTVKYGLLDPDPKRLAAVVVRHGMSLGKMGRISLTLGQTCFFSTPDYDVVYASVSSPDLADLNRAIGTRLRCAPSNYDSYIPHVTIAYVKAGLGKKYDKLTALSGLPVIADHIVLSYADNTRVEVSLMEGQTNVARPIAS